MMRSPATLVATPFARLPEALHYRGDPTEWVRLTRPGQRLHSFLEGPCFDAQGRLWLVDVPYGRIFCIETDGTWTLAHAYDGEPHAIRARPAGGFLVADHKRGLVAFDPDAKTIEVICAGQGTAPFRGLGDLAIASNGDVWMTDPARTSLTDPTGRVFVLRHGTTQPELVLSNVPYPNGIALSADQRQVFVSATRGNAVWSLLAQSPGTQRPMAGIHIQLSGGLGPDGLAVDSRGRLAVAQARAGRAYLFDESGDPVATVRTPGGSWTTACAFSPDECELYVIEAETATIFRCLLPEFATHAGENPHSTSERSQ